MLNALTHARPQPPLPCRLREAIQANYEDWGVVDLWLGYC